MNPLFRRQINVEYHLQAHEIGVTTLEWDYGRPTIGLVALVDYHTIIRDNFTYHIRDHILDDVE